MVRYQLGRSASYALAGACAANVGDWLITRWQASYWSEVLVVFVVLTLGIAAWRAWPKPKHPVSRERLPVMTAVLTRLPVRPGLIGFFSVLLPCGALAGALTLSVATHDGRTGAMLMLGFACSSALGLFGMSALMHKWHLFARMVRRPIARRAFSVACVGSALLVLWAFQPAPKGHSHQCHMGSVHGASVNP